MSPFFMRATVQYLPARLTAYFMLNLQTEKLQGLLTGPISIVFIKLQKPFETFFDNEPHAHVWLCR